MLKTLYHIRLWSNYKYFNVFTYLVNKRAVGSKTKFKMPKPGFYAVRVGKVPGVYRNWYDCESQVKGFPNASYKKFPTLNLANDYIKGESSVPMVQIKKATPKVIKQLDFNEFCLPDDLDIWSDCNFDEDITPVITSVSELSTFVPKITYSCSSMESYYAVHRGKIPGVYKTWTECSRQIKDFKNASYRKFDNEQEAFEYVRTGGIQKASKRELRDLEIGNKVIQNQNEFCLPDDLDIWSDCNFDEDITPVITSVSELSTFVPKIRYSTSSKESYYAVHRGKIPGVYKTWTECSRQIEDFRNASYRKFDNEQEALEYVRTGGIQKASKRELRDLEISNKVKKKRKLNGSRDFEYKLKNPEDTVVVFTDGASSENGKKRSRAGIGVYWGVNHPLNTSKRITGRQTNNRAEIYAAVHALNQAKQIGARKVRLYTDSQFVIHSITDWIKKWKANGWKLVTGKDVVNKEDFLALSAAEEGLDVEWIYVRAHARNKGNDEADRLAVAGRRLLLQPENCSEFQNVQIDSAVEQNVDTIPFLLTSASISPRKALPLILPDVKDKKPYYAVHRGKNPGVYATWTECEQQIKDFPKPFFKKFLSENEAKEFVRTGKIVKEGVKIPECKEDEFVIVFTDGASSSNGTEDARAGIGVYWGPGNALNSSMRLPGRQTNNRAEIFAAVHALRQAKQLGINNVRLYTDSQFVIKGINTWIEKWKKNNWKLASGKSVINKDDFIALDNARQGLNVDWCYVKGHSNNPGNVEADKLAVAGCSKSLKDTKILL